MSRWWACRLLAPTQLDKNQLASETGPQERTHYGSPQSRASTCNDIHVAWCDTTVRVMSGARSGETSGDVVRQPTTRHVWRGVGAMPPRFDRLLPRRVGGAHTPDMPRGPHHRAGWHVMRPWGWRGVVPLSPRCRVWPFFIYKKKRRCAAPCRRGLTRVTRHFVTRIRYAFLPGFGFRVRIRIPIPWTECANYFIYLFIKKKLS